VRDYRLISADSHVTEPPTVWADRMLVLAEGDCSWLPYVKEQTVDRLNRIHPDTRPKMKLMPSAYFAKNIFTTYITDHYGVQQRHGVGVSQMMWSSDYPHTGTHWPNSWKVIEKDYEGVDEDERRQILAGNAARIYGFGKS